MEGKIIGGYNVLAPLGQGTFGQTWLAEKDNLKYAIKIFRNEMIRSKNDARRIDREIKALKIVDHPNVIKYVDDGVYAEGFDKFRYLVMQYANGEPLRNFIERQGRLTVAQTQRISIQLLEGIKAIHDAGLLHRDLKPDNIYINTFGNISILDFGLVKLLDASTLTATGVPMGTFAYMAPEQLQDSKNVDYRADLYSLGAVIFHMITGRIPLEIFSLVEAPYKILNEIPPFASSLNPAVPNILDNIISTLLEKEMHKRKYTIDTLYLELRNLDDRSIDLSTADLTIRFLPRLLHNERTLVEEFNKNHSFDGIVFPANFFPKYRAVFDTIKHSGKFTIIDPVVYRLAYSKFSNTQSLVSLPYILSSFSKEKPSDFSNLQNCQDRARKVMDWQIKQNPSVLVAPFHFLSGVGDAWIEVDLKVYKECQKYLEEINEKRPLYTGISIQIESITDEISSTRLVNSITRTQPGGFLLMFDVNLNSFNRSHYYSFAKIVSMLGDLKKPIIISRVNDFGLGLMSFGATGISSGIGYIEDFKESILIEEGTGYFLKPKYYIPELMTSFNEKALTDVFKPAIGKSLVCNCPFCKGSMDVDYLLTPNVAKGHYLLQKQKQVELLNEMAKPERLRWFNDATIKAESLLRQLKKATKSKYIQYNHFMLWRDSLTQIEKERKAASSFPSVAQ